MQDTFQSSTLGENRAPVILLRSSWQTVNIGDISHTPGILTLVKRYLPDARVILWPNRLGEVVHTLLTDAFPDLEIVEPPSESDQLDEWARALFSRVDCLLHSSGPDMVAMDTITLWRELTDKPYGIYGVTLDPLLKPTDDPDVPGEGAVLAVQRKQIECLPADHMPAALAEVIQGAAFMFCRDTLTLDYVRRQCPDAPGLGFALDAAFGMELRDDARAEAFLRENKLEKGEYICVIPRLRYTPYHLILGIEPSRRDTLREEISDRHCERDMDKLRDFIIRWVRETGVSVLLCPEMTYQIEVGKRYVYDLLPPDVREHVVWRSDYWLPGEASSTYAWAEMLVSMDNHSPIFSLVVGTPTLFLRHPTDTIKGQMWHDIAMGDWFMETDLVEGVEVFDRAMAIHRDRKSALARVDEIMARARAVQDQSFDRLAAALGVTVTVN